MRLDDRFASRAMYLPIASHPRPLDARLIRRLRAADELFSTAARIYRDSTKNSRHPFEQTEH